MRFCDGGSWHMLVNVGQIQFDRRFGLDAGLDTGVLQCLEVGLRIVVRQIALECHRPATEQALDGGDVALEQRREIEFGGADIDTWQQSAVEYDLETVFAHCRGILVARVLMQRVYGQPCLAGSYCFSVATAWVTARRVPEPCDTRRRGAGPTGQRSAGHRFRLRPGLRTTRFSKLWLHRSTA
ncbi:hypothetical protein D3C84_727620 [compost metagenome]